MLLIARFYWQTVLSEAEMCIQLEIQLSQIKLVLESIVQ